MTCVRLHIIEVGAIIVSFLHNYNLPTHINVYKGHIIPRMKCFLPNKKSAFTLDIS